MAALVELKFDTARPELDPLVKHLEALRSRVISDFSSVDPSLLLRISSDNIGINLKSAENVDEFLLKHGEHPLKRRSLVFYDKQWDFNWSQLKKTSPSSTFEDQIHRLVATVNLTKHRARKHMIEAFIMESLFNNAPDGDNLRKYMVGLHPDFELQKLAFENADSHSFKVYDVLEYLAIPHFKLPSPGSELANSTRATPICYEKQSVCAIFYLNLANFGNVSELSQLITDRYLTTLQLLMGKSGNNVGALNVIFTDGIRWTFGRFYSADETRDRDVDARVANLYEREPDTNDVATCSSFVYCKFSDILSVSKDEGNHILGLLRHWVRGFVPTELNS